MPHRSWLRWLALAAAGTALAAAGCSSSEAPPASSSTTAAPATSAPGTTETDQDAQAAAFCAEAEARLDVLASDAVSDPTDDDAYGELVEGLADLTQYVPDEIYDDWEVVRSTITDIYELEPAAREDALIDLVGDDELLDAQENVDAFMDDACGFTFSSDESDELDESDESDTSDTIDGEAEDAMSVDALQAYLEESYPGEAWVEDLNSWSIATLGSGSQVEVATSEAWTAEQGIAVCDAVAGWLFSLTDEGSVTVLIDTTPLAVQESASGSCEAA